MSSDEVGRLGAVLAVEDRWDSEVDRNLTRVRWL